MASATRVVVHEDDVGMNHGANAAFAELFELGVCTAGSVMVPCPWFLEVAEMQAKNPRLDIGVHLVLTSEFRTYRWRPLTGASQASGLVDADGYFWRTANEARAHAHPDAVEAELRAQVDAAKAAGIDITHIDAHMFTALVPAIHRHLHAASDAKSACRCCWSGRTPPTARWRRALPSMLRSTQPTPRACQSSTACWRRHGSAAPRSRRITMRSSTGSARD